MKNKRYLESLAPLIHQEQQSSFLYPYKILCSPSDQGVMRNNGKNGARYAPKALMNALKKFNNHLNLEANEAILVSDVTSSFEELQNFENAQKDCALAINKYLCNAPEQKLVHLGGGHDQVFPLLIAIDQCGDYDNIFIINIDAHCDTRIDDISHSGTPFRNFDVNGKKPFHLVQYGIHPYANSISTLTNLKRGTEERLFYRDLYKETQGFTEITNTLLKGCPFTINDRTAVLLSLDCDGIDGSQMQAVSAVNSSGVPGDHILDLIHHLRRMTGENFIFGIYEFNPVYDTVNQQSAKLISHLIYDYLIS